MARTEEEILAQMNETQASQPDLVGLNSQSQTSIFGLWKYIPAKAMQLLEQLWDRKQTEIESKLAYGVPPSLAWLRSKAFEFQYGYDLELVNFVPQYPVIDTSARIITRCTIAQVVGGVVNVYVAKSEPPEKLTAPELTAIQGYYTNAGDSANLAVGVGYGGQVLTVISLDPDLLYFKGTITYNGKFANTIQNDTFTAMTNFLSSLGQNPVFKTVDFINTLRSVPGFVDVDIENLAGRNAATGFGSKTNLVVSHATSATEYTSDAGYMIGETDPTHTFADTITFTAV